MGISKNHGWIFRNIEGKTMSVEIEKVTALCDYVTKTSAPRMKWTWGEALFGWALSQMDDFLGESRYDSFLCAYCGYYLAHFPRVESSDTAAPALISYAMQKKHPERGYERLTAMTLDYLLHEKRLIGDTVNHLGNSFLGKFYPKSIWVDSLMMFSVFPSLYGREQGDAALLDLAGRQPGLYSRLMQDAEDKLWYHSYWTGLKSHYPLSKIYWARGNGWAAAALPMILENLGKEHGNYAEIAGIFRDTAAALRLCQNGDGSFNTLLKTNSYRELSATALVAAGFFRGCRLGLLPGDFAAAGEKAYRCCLAAVREEGGGCFFPEISGPTIPVPLCPRLGYLLVPKAGNWSYGLAALVFAALEYEKMRGNGD
jgi:unsaturated rhamnogalacturonyl hydrolase